jgi:hypothetical protein
MGEGFRRRVGAPYPEPYRLHEDSWALHPGFVLLYSKYSVWAARFVAARKLPGVAVVVATVCCFKAAAASLFQAF